MGSGSTPINQQLKRHVERSGSLSQRPNAGNFSIFQLCTERFDELQEFEVANLDGKVKVMALKGHLSINDESGTTTLPQEIGRAHV